MIVGGRVSGATPFLFLPPLARRFGPNRGGGIPPVGAEEFSMGSLSIWHWIVVIAVVLLLFGRGKISELMGDVAQGIKAFKKGMSDDETAKADAGRSRRPSPARPSPPIRSSSTPRPNASSKPDRG